MKKLGKTSSGSFVNYSNSSSALPAYFKPLPSCAAGTDEMWVLEAPDVQEFGNVLERKSK